MLQDNLDANERFAAHPAETTFFTQLLRIVVHANANVDFHVAPIRIL